MATDYQSLGSATGSILGLGLGIYGALGASSAAKHIADEEKQIAALEQQADQQRRTAMEISARRYMMQNVRNSQVARSMALSTATNQGAQFSSGLAGGYGSISGQTGTNILGISQNLQIGEKLFDINSQIDSAKIEEAKYKGQEADFSAIGSLGKGLGALGGDIGKFMMFGA